MKLHLFNSSTRYPITRLHLRTCYAEASAKARLTCPISRKPDFLDYESTWRRFWQKKDYFKSSEDVDNRPVYSMIFPPPNITGNLHLGHALTLTIQDSIARYKSMTGHRVCWVPGFDHAGIATHIILNKISLQRFGKHSSELNESEFTALSEEWKNERMNEMKVQLESLGASFTHPYYYTLSPQMSAFVKRAFVQLFNSQIIKRKKSLVNWSFLLQSTISDIEIEWRKFYKPTLVHVPGHGNPVEYGVIYTVAYPIEGTNETIAFATTRIETLCGDVAIAVNPNDIRFAKYVGRQAVNPLTGELLPIIADDSISLDVGTGAMKVTPSHSSLDFDLCSRHNIAHSALSIFDEKGNIYCSNLKESFRHLNGMSRFEAKGEMVKIFTELGLFISKSPHETVVPFCSRCGDVVESITRYQWFIQMAPLVKELKGALEANEIAVEPPGGKSTWLRKWCASLDDWCISRQIKWGHSIPAFRPCDNACHKVSLPPESSWVAAYDESDARSKLLAKYPSLPEDFVIYQDEDVLDTWFSSALLPFTVIKSIDQFNETSEQETTLSLADCELYPLSLMETGHDILPFWVHRMAILSKVLTGAYGFKKVLMHGMVSDAHGKKMTKSKGNVIDPLDVIKGATLQQLLSRVNTYHQLGILNAQEAQAAQEGSKLLFPEGIPTCGTDALRLALVHQDIKPIKIKLSINHFTDNRAFINKMWQAFRFVTFSADKIRPREDAARDSFILHLTRSPQAKNNLTNFDLWIISRLAHLVNVCTEAYSVDACDLHLVHFNTQQFWTSEMCSIYLEHVKKSIQRVTNDVKRCDSESDAENDLASPDTACTSFSILVHCMSTCLRILHPIAPFVTEELYQRMLFLLDTVHMDDHSVEKKREIVSIVKSGFPCVSTYAAWTQFHGDINVKVKSVRTMKEKKKKESSPLGGQCVNEITRENE